MKALPKADAEAGIIDPAAIENADGAGPFVVICDHASNHIPEPFGSLGLNAESREAHIAWDPGALGVSRMLAQRLGAPLIYATVSRLVIDCNRGLDAPDLIVTESEGTPVPGNASLSVAERERRIATVHEPYHRVIDVFVSKRLSAKVETALVAVHSFTPVFGGVERPWQVGVVFDRDRKLADRLIGGLNAMGLSVGVNEPYSPADRVYTTMTRHAERRGLGAVMIEIRNDLIRDTAEQAVWAERLGTLLAPLTPGAAAAKRAMIAGAE